MKLGFWIPDSWSCIMDSKAQGPGLQEQNFPIFRILQAIISRTQGSLTGSETWSFFSFYRQRRMSWQPLQEWRYMYEYSWKLSLQVHICLHWQKLWKRSGSIWYLALNRLITEAQPVFNRLSFFQIHFLKSCLKSLFYILKWYKRVLAEVKRWKGDMKRKQLTKHFGIGFSRADNYV